MEPTAILIAPDGAGGALHTLMDRLSSVGVVVTIVDEIATAVELAARHETPPAVLLDLRHVAGGEIEDLKSATAAIRRARRALPAVSPVVITNDADARLIVACLRAGAGDVIDLQLEGTATARAVVHRICQLQSARWRELDIVEQQRQMIEDLLKDLIRTERRSIDAEERLAARARTGEMPAVVEVRPPAVLLVEHERAVADELADLLEAAGIATYAYVTGEEALREAATLADTTGLDIALVAAQLPGIDGLETIRRLRAGIPKLPAFLVTSVVDADLAAHAADLGVVGFVQKPLAAVDELVERLAQLARDALHHTRESLYLQRIKERHERVLARYRSLPREL
ncbi:MAG: response regulator [Deltaproteobacteria bacterium]|nr:response regulator [Deltaproteobacteria bacterium]